MANTKWVAGWGASISVVAQNHADYIKDQTFRYVIFPTMDGEALRLHLSNQYGTEPVTVDKMYVARRTKGEYVDTATNVRVTFGGCDSVTIPAGEAVVSDAVGYSVKAGEEFAVSMYFAGLTQLVTGHSNNGYYIKKYYGKGDWAADECVPLEEYGENGPYILLNTIDFLTSDDCSAIIAFGDSITAQPWPDCLAHRIFDNGIRNRAVIRKGIGGSRILRDYRFRIKKHWGERGINRFERDICQAGVDRVFVLHGINDLIHPGVNNRLCPMTELPDSAEMIEQGYKKYIEIARKHGKKIYLATILPCPRCMNDDGAREKTRCEVNEWIRTTDLIDGVIDFEKAVWDENDHKQIKAEYDSGDHLHPSFAGAECMANSIPMEYITD
ncbi:MAG: lipase [Clostridia bacterium]|nr:lipase [Clostridia bacterium]